MVQKNHSTKFYFLMAFFLSSVIFISGIGIGLVIDQFKSESITLSIQEMQDSLQDAEIELLVMDYLGGNISCDYLSLKSSELSERSSELGNQLDVFEQSNNINSDVYVPLKQQYMRILIKNWITLENIKESCNSGYDTILYFYNNNNCSKCDEQATILQYYKRLLEDDVMIFAIDSGLDISVVDLLKYHYGVEEYPSIVFNGELYSGYQDYDKIGELLN